MKILITAADISNMAKNAQKTLCLPAHSLITPAARDAARDNGMEIVFESADEPRDTQTPFKAADDKSGNADGNGINPALLAQIVGEVLAGLNLSGSLQLPLKDVDPCGLRLVRSGGHIPGDTPGGRSLGSGYIAKELIAAPDSPFLAAGLAALEASSRTNNTRQDEVNYILDGLLTVVIQGRRYTAKSGDLIYIPSGNQVTYITETNARWLFVTQKK